MSTTTMRQMLEAGVHFGHQTRYWNPKMAPYIFGSRSRIHIINLEKTLPLFNEAMRFLEQMAANQGKVLFVGTKKTAREVVQKEAINCGMPYVNHRWLGGMLTNFATIKKSINRLKELETMEKEGGFQRFSKKEALGMKRELDKLERSVGGIKDMGGIPDALFIIDVGYEKNAVKEAKKLGIPIIGVVDTNNSANDIDYMIPGNDDSIRSIQLYCQSAAASMLKGKVNEAEKMSVEDDFVEVEEAKSTPPAEEEATSED